MKQTKKQKVFDTDEAYPGYVGWFSFSAAVPAGENRDIAPIAEIRMKNGRDSAFPLLFCVQVELQQPASQVDPKSNWPECWWYGKAIEGRKPIIVSYIGREWHERNPETVLQIHRDWGEQVRVYSEEERAQFLSRCSGKAVNRE